MEEVINSFHCVDVDFRQIQRHIIASVLPLSRGLKDGVLVCLPSLLPTGSVTAWGLRQIENLSDCFPSDS